MKITLSGALIALLLWDYSVSPPGQSVAARIYGAAAASEVFGPVIASARSGLGDLRPILIDTLRQVGDNIVGVADAQSLNANDPSVQAIAKGLPAQKKR